MKVNEIIKPTKPKSPEQIRVAALKTAADQASAAVSSERQRQRLNKARRDLAILRSTI
jgi:hypothetical protein